MESGIIISLFDLRPSLRDEWLIAGDYAEEHGLPFLACVLRSGLYQPSWVFSGEQSGPAQVYWYELGPEHTHNLPGWQRIDGLGCSDSMVVTIGKFNYYNDRSFVSINVYYADIYLTVSLSGEGCTDPGIGDGVGDGLGYGGYGVGAEEESSESSWSSNSSLSCYGASFTEPDDWDDDDSSSSYS